MAEELVDALDPRLVLDSRWESLCRGPAIAPEFQQIGEASVSVVRIGPVRPGGSHDREVARNRDRFTGIPRVVAGALRRQRRSK